MQQLGSVCAKYLAAQANVEKRIWVLDGDLADSDGAEHFVAQHPMNFIAGGIAEQNMVSVAAGLAAAANHPWVFSFAAFLCYRAYDQIRIGISQTNLPVTLVGSHAGGCGGRNGKTHLALNDIAVMATLPNIEIWTPADSLDMKFATQSILSAKRPAYLRCPRDPQPDLFKDYTETVRWIGQPSEIAIISYGLSTQWAVRAQQMLAEENIDVGVLHFCKLWPLDKQLLKKHFNNIKVAIVVEDHYPIGGLNSFLHHYNINDLCELISMAWPINWLGQSGDAESLLSCYGLSADAIVNKLKHIIHDAKVIQKLQTMSMETVN